MNAPNVAELYYLDDGEKLVETTEDTKIPNAATFKIIKQDHTLGNMLRSQLLTNPHILFAGYKLPHPLHPYFILKIQTDGTITPQDALESATKDLIGTLAMLESKFKKEFDYKRTLPGSTTTAAAAMQHHDPYATGDWGAATGSSTAAAATGTGDYLDL